MIILKKLNISEEWCSYLSRNYEIEKQNIKYAQLFFILQPLPTVTFVRTYFLCERFLLMKNLFRVFYFR